MEVLEQMSGYAKFTKGLVTKKRTAIPKPTNILQHYSAITTRWQVEKKEDLRAFTIPCTVRAYDFARALCYLGARINLMPLVVYKQLGLEALTPITMRLLMLDKLVKRLVGILCDVLVRVDKFIFPTDFVILYF